MCAPSPSKLVKEPFVWLTSLPVCYYTARYKVNSGTRILVYRSLRSRSWRRERAGSEAKGERGWAWIGCRRWSSESLVVRTSRSDVKIFSARRSKNGEAYLASRRGCSNDYFRGLRERPVEKLDFRRCFTVRRLFTTRCTAYLLVGWSMWRIECRQRAALGCFMNLL